MNTPCRSTCLSAFTLIELMIVMSVMAIAMAIGVPAMFRMAEKDSVRKTVNEIVEACHATRAEAIMSGQVQTMTINPRAQSISAPGKSRGVTIPKNYQIELLGVNFVELQDSDHAPVRFFPNGTSDEFTIVLRSDKNEYRKISLEIITGRADVESDIQRF